MVEDSPGEGEDADRPIRPRARFSQEESREAVTIERTDLHPTENLFTP